MKTPAGARPFTTVRLYARPSSLKSIDITRLDEATSLNDQPFGVLELEDGSRVFFAVVRTRSGRLRLNVEREVARLRKAKTG